MEMTSHILWLVFLVGCVLEAALACKVTTLVRSETKTPFKFRIVIPSLKAVTEEVLFTHEGQQKQVVVDGVDCVTKHWIFQTSKRDKNGKWHRAKEGKAKLDGNGRMVIGVNDDLEPHIGERFAVACSESVICG